MCCYLFAAFKLLPNEFPFADNNYTLSEYQSTGILIHRLYVVFLFTPWIRQDLLEGKLKSHLKRTHSSSVLPLKPAVGQYIAMHATFTARDFFLADVYPSGPFTCIFSDLSRVFLVLAVASTGPCVGLQNKIGHSAGCRFLSWVLAEYK